MPLLLLFILMPVTELYLLLTLGSWIGAGWTILLILMTALMGMSLLRSQGLATLFRANQRVKQGEIPLQELAEGFLLALAGALLITPGLLTDVIGFSLLVPMIRSFLAHRVGRFFQHQSITMMGSGSFERPSATTSRQYGSNSSHSEHVSPEAWPNRAPSSKRGGEVIEGEYHHADDDKKN